MIFGTIFQFRFNPEKCQRNKLNEVHHGDNYIMKQSSLAVYTLIPLLRSKPMDIRKAIVCNRVVMTYEKCIIILIVVQKLPGGGDPTNI